MTVNWNSIPGETPIDVSGLKISGVSNREELAVVEAENVRQSIVKYFGGSLTRRTAKFDLTWMLKLHREMFGEVWKWAGETRTTDLNLGVPWHQVTTQLQDLCDNLTYWESHWPDIVEQAAHLPIVPSRFIHFRTAMVAGHDCSPTSGSSCTRCR